MRYDDYAPHSYSGFDENHYPRMYGGELHYYCDSDIAYPDSITKCRFTLSPELVDAIVECIAILSESQNNKDNNQKQKIYIKGGNENG